MDCVTNQTILILCTNNKKQPILDQEWKATDHIFCRIDIKVATNQTTSVKNGGTVGTVQYSISQDIPSRT